MIGPDDQAIAPTIIVRRQASRTMETPKGGVWKIAYADFMTAMMAFFLVMWLINATSESTKQGVANYFNPIMLADAKMPRKGVNSADRVQLSEQGRAGDGEDGATPSEAGGDEGPGTDEADQGGVASDAIFRDPYAVLAAIELEGDGEKEPQKVEHDPLSGGSGEVDRAGTEALRDPFGPVFLESVGDSGGSKSSPTEDIAAGPTTVSPDETGVPAQDHAGTGPLEAGESLASDTLEPEGDPSHGAFGETDDVLDGLRSEIASALDDGGVNRPAIDVGRVDGGLLISLTDEVNFGMFAIGSAEPKRATVETMATIAAILGKRRGGIVIRGHTDGRPYRSGNYDNWRLSTARAHMAHYMLVHGGLAEARILRIEGRADRDPRIKTDPMAAENRRIEILLREEDPE